MGTVNVMKHTTSSKWSWYINNSLKGDLKQTEIVLWRLEELLQCKCHSFCTTASNTQTVASTISRYMRTYLNISIANKQSVTVDSLH